MPTVNTSSVSPAVVLEIQDRVPKVVSKMSSERLLRGQKLARESAMLAAPRRLHNTKLDDFDMVKTIGTGERLRYF